MRSIEKFNCNSANYQAISAKKLKTFEVNLKALQKLLLQNVGNKKFKEQINSWTQKFKWQFELLSKPYYNFENWLNAEFQTQLFDMITKCVKRKFSLRQKDQLLLDFIPVIFDLDNSITRIFKEQRNTKYINLYLHSINTDRLNGLNETYDMIVEKLNGLLPELKYHLSESKKRQLKKLFRKLENKNRIKGNSRYAQHIHEFINSELEDEFITIYIWLYRKGIITIESKKSKTAFIFWLVMMVDYSEYSPRRERTIYNRFNSNPRDFERLENFYRIHIPSILEFKGIYSSS